MVKCAADGGDWIKYMNAAKKATPVHNAIPISVVNGNSSCPPPTNLIKVVCAAYTGTPPAACTKANEAALPIVVEATPYMQW